MYFNHLIPVRFLSLMIQLILSILVFTSMDGNIKAAMWLPSMYSPSLYSSYMNQLIVAASLSIAFNAFELIGLFTGISTFANSQTIISSLAHISGSVVLILFHLENWPSYLFWYVFGFCSCVPFVTELFVWISVLMFQRHL